MSNSLILDQFGNVLKPDPKIEKSVDVAALRRSIQRELRAKYDAAQTNEANKGHWSNVDNLNPHAAAGPTPRYKMRQRSRYEIQENNPYLKGCIIQYCNDMVGSGPRLRILDERLSDKAANKIEKEFHYWCQATGFYTKLWRLLISKKVDGESFGFSFTNPRRALGFEDIPVTIDWYLAETDRIVDPPGNRPSGDDVYQIDGLRWDRYDQPIEYNLSPIYPQNVYGGYSTASIQPNWVAEEFVIHWLRQDRGWLRGIPELAASLSLCSILRRYTLAVLRAAEVAASFSAVLETNGPPTNTFWGDSDDPFDTFPIEPGMLTTMPWGYKLSQIRAEQPIQVYDMYVSALLREIVRPLLMPYNVAAGTSKDSNMASSVVDVEMYKSGQRAERYECERRVLHKAFVHWYREARLVRGYLPVGRLDTRIPEHSWGWDAIGLEHTDPQKVWGAVEIAQKNGYITDQDIQDRYFNRDLATWQSQISSDIEFRKKVGLITEPPPPETKSPLPKKP